jgi:hypothetical protein
VYVYEGKTQKYVGKPKVEAAEATLAAGSR